MRLEANRRKWALTVVVAAAVFLAAAAFDVRLKVRCYSVESEKIDAPVRLALVTDLHSCRYGEGQRVLIDAIDAQKPDLVLMSGDIFDDALEDTNAEIFLRGIVDRYPCFYVTGNHEYQSGSQGFAEKLAILEKLGIEILSGECETLSVNGRTINVCGVEDPEGSGSESVFFDQLDAVSAAAQNGNFTVLLSHRPEYWEKYREGSFDLTLCGHAHGGQWRIPGLLNGLFAPNQGLFPELAGGMYEQDGKTMIVSRGLARESTRVPRIFNRPELVIIDVV